MGKDFAYENKGCEKFLANKKYWEYIGLELSRDPWCFDEQKPTESLRELNELRHIISSVVNEMLFDSPPVLWHGNRRAIHWGKDLINGNFQPWKDVQRRSGQFSDLIFYPTKKRDFDFMLCVNKYFPVALTRILDVRFHNEKKLRDILNATGLEFEYSTSKPILFPKEPKACNLDDVRNFVSKLDQLKENVSCSIRELGECSRFF